MTTSKEPNVRGELALTANGVRMMDCPQARMWISWSIMVDDQKLLNASNNRKPGPGLIRAAQTGVFDLDIQISNRPFIDVCKSFAAETGLKSRNIEKRINAV
jgi:hypothetical protein